MKLKNSVSIVILCLLSSISLPKPAPAQQWSQEQKDVWGTVEDLWAAFAKGDLDAQFDLISDDYRGWNSQNDTPYTKVEARAWNVREQKNRKAVLYHIFPFAIDIHGDIAIAFYSYETVREQSDGTDVYEKGRWTDIYRMTNGEWLLIADCEAR